MPEDNSLHLASAVLVHRAALLLKDHDAEGLREKERKEKKRQSISIILSITFFAGFWGEFFYFVSFCKCMFFFCFFFAFCLMGNTAGMDGGSSFWKYLMTQANEAMRHRENGDSSAAPSVKSPSS